MACLDFVWSVCSQNHDKLRCWWGWGQSQPPSGSPSVRWVPAVLADQQGIRCDWANSALWSSWTTFFRSQLQCRCLRTHQQVFSSSCCLRGHAQYCSLHFKLFIYRKKRMPRTELGKTPACLMEKLVWAVWWCVCVAWVNRTKYCILLSFFSDMQ